MGVYRPLGAVLFFYEALRLLLLVILLLIAPREGPVNGVLSAYLSPNALFPLMALFVWLRPEEYRNYLNLYIAGKVIVLVSFYVWVIFSSREFLGVEDAARSVLLLGGCLFLCLADNLSVMGAWTIKNKYRQALVRSLEPNDLTEGGI